MNYCNTPPSSDSLRLESVTVSVGFDDVLDETLKLNHPHFDTMIIVTSHDDWRTKMVAKKHSATCVLTDLFNKNGRNFNKGAAINAGLSYFQWNGWRLHLDADIALPDNFRRVLFNHTHLDETVLYGADRVDVIGKKELRRVRENPQHMHGMFVNSNNDRTTGHRFLDSLHGYVPIGYFQLWHALCHKPYPYSLGTAAHDDVMFGTLWPRSQRQLLPGVIVHHLCAQKPRIGENWDGKRRHPRFK